MADVQAWLRAGMEFLAQLPSRSARRAEVRAAMSRAHPPKETQLELRGKERKSSFESSTHWWWQNAKKAGLVDQLDGNWIILEKGLEALKTQPEQVAQLARKGYNEWKRSRPKPPPQEPSAPHEEYEGPTDDEVWSGPDPARRIWLLGTGEGGNQWPEFRDRGVAAIGFRKITAVLGSAKGRSLEEIRAITRSVRADGSSGMHDSLALFEFANEIQRGDLIVARSGRRKIVGVGVVTGAYECKLEGPGFPHQRSVAWNAVEFETTRLLVTKALTEITSDTELVDELRKLSTEHGLDESAWDDDAAFDLGEEAPGRRPYTREQAIAGVFVDGGQFDRIVERARAKKAVVLQGPPGTGKTFVADRIARLLTGFDTSPDRHPSIERIQFHQAYAYEDFIEGIRPIPGGGFERRDGVFKRFCARAALAPQDTFVLIIDEINRGNVSRILGETMVLLETDKRGESFAMRTAYSGDSDPLFSVPNNLIVLGLMNTADRSLALVDFALRRRFAFFELRPAFEGVQFGSFLAGEGAPSALVDRIKSCMADVNDAIRKDSALGRGFEIGHSFFTPPIRPEGDDAWSRWACDVVVDELDPLIDEYLHDLPERAAEIRERLDPLRVR